MRRKAVGLALALLPAFSSGASGRPGQTARIGYLRYSSTSRGPTFSPSLSPRADRVIE